MSVTLELPDALVARLKARPEPPAWLEKIQPRLPATDGTNGVHRAFGVLEVPESHEELIRLLQDES
jgi:hypothetical protein